MSWRLLEVTGTFGEVEKVIDFDIFVTCLDTEKSKISRKSTFFERPQEASRKLLGPSWRLLEVAGIFLEVEKVIEFLTFL